MKKLFFYLGIFFPMYLFAQKAEINGVVTDADTKEPLLSVTIKVGDQGASTDMDGKFQIKLDPGTYKLLFSYVGYQNLEKEITLTPNQVLNLEFSMIEAELMLNTATVTSSKFEKPLGEVTVSMEVVRPKLIENTNAVAVNEVLDKLPGVNMLEDQVDIRGGAGYAQGTGSRVLMLMDDLPVLQVDAGLPQWRDLPTENVSQIEVVKGASSALYGSTAMNGIINIRTAYPTSKPLTKVSLSGKLFDNPRDLNNKWWTSKNMPYESNLQLAHRQKFGKLDLVAGANLYSESSFMRGYDIDTTGGVDTLPNSAQAARLSVGLRYRLSEKVILGLNTNINIGSQNRHLFWETGAGSNDYNLYQAAAEAIPIRGKYYRFTIDPSVLIFDNKDGKHRILSRYYHITNDNENKQSNQSDFGYLEYQYQRKFDKLWGIELATGVVGSISHVTAEVYSNSQFDLGNFAAYVQLEKKFFDRLNVSLGVRYELNILNTPDSILFDNGFTAPSYIRAIDTTEGLPVFRLGLNYRLFEGTYLRASWGQAYRFPTIVEKFISTSTGTLGINPNPNLKSETGWSSEIGIKQGIKLGRWQGFVDLAGFWSEYNNMMEFTFLFAYFQVRNIGNTRILGGEISLGGQGKIGPVNLDIVGGYTYLNPQYKNYNTDVIRSISDSVNVLKYRSRHTAKIDVQAEYKGLSTGFTFMYMSYMENIDWYLDQAGTFPSIREFRDRPEIKAGTFIFNARLSYKYKFVKLSFLANNILNNEYWVRPGRLEAPRNFALRLDFTIEGKEKSK